jgi:hypothetical protein
VSWLRRSVALSLPALLQFAHPAGAATPDPNVPYATSTGAIGVAERVSDIMGRQHAADAAGRQPLRDAEEKEDEHPRPDRSGLPQNPGSVDAPFSRDGRFSATPDGGPVTNAPQSIGTNFTGATLSGVNPTSSYPPDCMGAVGPTQYFLFVNGRLVTFDKTTGIADGAINADPDVFFTSVLNNSSTSDPRIRYDRLTGRWILVIINVSTPNRILLAVSSPGSSTITGSTTFTFFYIPVNSTPPTIGNNCFADYPTLGVDVNALYIGTNDFCGNYKGTDAYVVRKSSVLGAGPIVVTAFRQLCTSSGPGPYTPQGVDNYDPNATEGYFIGVDNATYGLLQLRRVSNPGGTPTLSSNVTITVPTTIAPLKVPHLGNTGGTSGQLDALDDRLFAAHIRNGQLWTAHNIGVTNTGSTSGTITRDGSRWYHLNVPVGSGTPTLVESGTLYAPSASNTTDQRFYWIPSIMVSGQGHAAMAFSTAGTNEYTNAGTAGRLSGDAAGTLQAPVSVTSSSTAYNPPADPGDPSYGRRWGDYSYVSLDPIDDMTMWSVHMFSDTTNSYGVRVTKLIAPPPAMPTTLADVTAGQSGITLTLTGSAAGGAGFYDPGADLAGGVPGFSHVSAAISNGSASGTPPTVTSVAYLSPTSLSVTLDASTATANASGEKYTLTITNPDGQTAAAAVVHVVATPPTATLAAGPSASEGNAGTSNFDFTVNLSAASVSPVTVRYQTSDGTATVADGDYVAVNDSIVIAPGLTTGTIHVPVNGDTKYESDEAFGVTLTGATGATLGSPVAATGTIQNDDAPPALSIDSVSHPEGNTGTTGFHFTVTLSQASGLPATVNWATADSTATVTDNDYAAGSGQVVIPAGSLTGGIDVNVNGDTTTEPDEVFHVVLSGAVGATIASGTGRGTIRNDDDVPALSIAGVSALEGNSGTTPFKFPVTLSAPSATPVSVHWATADGSATVADDDYAAGSGTLTIPALATSDTIIVNVNGDGCGEPDETFTVNLTNPAGATIATAAATGTIRNDDETNAPSVTVTAPNGGETIEVAATATLTWTASDDVGVTGVDLLLSRDDGVTYPETIASGIPNTGSYDWTVTPPATTTAFLRVRAHDAACNVGADASDAAFEIDDHVTSVDGATRVTTFALGAVRPNPSRGAVAFAYQLPREANVRLSVVDVQGREVATLRNDLEPAGVHSLTWSGITTTGVAARGLYFVRYQAGGKTFVRRFALIR